mgnify:CR=1 FL=1
MTCCFENIEDELHHPIDIHSDTILSRHIELLLDYCTRYYERQFITRENKNKAIIERLENLFDECILSGKVHTVKPSLLEYYARKLNLSVAYFDDLLKFETGETFEEYFQFKRLDIAKRMLLQTDNSPAIIAHRLGYPNVQYFSLIFKKIVGVAPNEYRYSRN